VTVVRLMRPKAAAETAAVLGISAKSTLAALLGLWREATRLSTLLLAGHVDGRAGSVTLSYRTWAAGFGSIKLFPSISDTSLLATVLL